MRISEPSFTDSGIDATGKTENQTCTRVDGRSAPSTLSLPTSQVSEIRGCACEGLSATPSQGDAEPRTRTLKGGLEGRSPSMHAPPRVVSAFLGRGNQDGSACADAGSPAFVYTLPKSCKRAQRAKACLLWCGHHKRQAETNPVRKRAGQDRG